MFRFIFGKLAYLLPTFIGITIVAFGFVRVLPGDPVLLWRELRFPFGIRFYYPPAGFGIAMIGELDDI